MLRYLLDKLMHRVPWNGDRIRMTYPDGSLAGEFTVVTDGDAIRLKEGNSAFAVRNDLPEWVPGHWTYRYDE